MRFLSDGRLHPPFTPFLSTPKIAVSGSYGPKKASFDPLPSQPMGEGLSVGVGMSPVCRVPVSGGLDVSGVPSCPADGCG